MFPLSISSSAAVIAVILAYTTVASSTATTNNATSTGSSSTNEIVFELLPLIRVYRDGRVERLCGNDILPASFDPQTRVVSKDVVIDSSAGITARLYLPTTSFPIQALTTKLPLLVYFHGGAFMIESAFSPSYHPHLNNLASLAPLIGVSINYRLAPENPLPIAYQDSWTALVWVFSKLDPWLAELADFDRVYVAGDSSGANIAHQLALRVGEEGLINSAVKLKGMALVHSYFWGKEPIAGERNDPKFRSDMEEIWRFLYPGTVGLDDPRINPVADTSPSLLGLGCDRVLVAVAEKDILWSRGRLYYEKLKASGWRGEAILVDTPDAEHDFHIFHPETEKAFNMTKTLAVFFGQDYIKNNIYGW